MSSSVSTERPGGDHQFSVEPQSEDLPTPEYKSNMTSLNVPPTRNNGLREDLIQQAVLFLSDPKVRNSPDDRKIAFLASKGLSHEEIQESFKKLDSSRPSSSFQQIEMTEQSRLPQRLSMTTSPSERQQHSSYTSGIKSFVLGTVFAGSVAYSLYHLVKKYFHHLVPEWPLFSQESVQLGTEIKRLKETITKTCDDHKDFINKQEEQSKAFDATIDSLNAQLAEWRVKEEKNQEDFLELKAQIETVQSLIPKAYEQSKEWQSSNIQEWKSELASLKILLSHRLSSTTTSGLGDGNNKEIEHSL